MRNRKRKPQKNCRVDDREFAYRQKYWRVALERLSNYPVLPSQKGRTA